MPSACNGFRNLSVTRRHLLQIGSAGLLGLSLPNILRAEEKSGRRKTRAKSVIFLHQFGGPTHIDSLDPKPGAPDGIRGEFKPIATKSPAIQVSEKLPRM